MKKILIRLAAIIMSILGLLIVIGDQGIISIIISTIIWIGAFTAFYLTNEKAYNQNVSMSKMVDIPKRYTLEMLMQYLGEMETPLGHAWLCPMCNFSNNKKVMVFGPNESGEYVYCYWMMEKFFIAVGNDVDWLCPETEEENEYLDSITSRDSESGISHVNLNAVEFVERLTNIISYLGKNGHMMDEEMIEKEFSKSRLDNIKQYVFMENFKLIGQRFSLSTIDGTSIYDIEGTIPLKTLRIYEHGTENELLRMTKRILHALPHYDFYQDEKKIGTFKKELKIFDEFSMDIDEGKITMRSIPESIGINYIVKLNDVQIGSINEDLNLNLENLVFDNFVLNVNDDKYLLIMTALGVMAVREIARDEAEDY